MEGRSFVIPEDVQSVAPHVVGHRLFSHQNIEKARDLMGQYKENISSQCDSITNDIILGRIDDLNSSNSTAVGLYARYLKRVSAHSRNLISSIVNPFERIGYPE